MVPTTCGTSSAPVGTHIKGSDETLHPRPDEPFLNPRAPMRIRTDSARKLTGDIAALLSEDLLQESQTIPVVVYCQDSEALTSLEDLLVEFGGQVRHTHNLTGAASAWIPLSAVRELAGADLVTEIELDQPSQIA